MLGKLKMRFAATHSQKPLPFKIYWLTNVGLSVVGLISSIYLTIAHYRVFKDIDYRSFCAISRTVNCDTVSQSPYAIFFGIPLALWGVIGYLFVLILLRWASKPSAGKKRGWGLLFTVSGGYSLLSVVLAYISNYLIHSYCIICIITYIVNFLLAYLSWLTGKRFDQTGLIKKIKSDFIYYFKENKRATARSLLPIVTVTVLLILFYPSYWTFSLPQSTKNIPTGITKEGFPWIGAEKPLHIITEFTDYQCFQCKKMHFFLRELIAKHPDKIRLVHRHFPMDRKYNVLVKDDFHAGSGKMALIAIYANAKNKFWEMNDFLFESAGGNIDTINLKAIAEKTDISPQELSWALSNKQIFYHLIKDLKDGLTLGITGTPAYVIDGEMHQATIPREILNEMINQ